LQELILLQANAEALFLAARELPLDRNAGLEGGHLALGHEPFIWRKTGWDRCKDKEKKRGY
jgi:hypothetical protein